MKTLTKKFRAVVFDGVVQEGWQDEQTGETIVSDSTQTFEADTLDELSAILKASGCDLTSLCVENKQLNQ
jgi:hypothetical protein